MQMKHVLAIVVVIILSATVSLCYAQTKEEKSVLPRMIVLGVDGMDPKLVRQYLDEGVLPNIKNLIESGGDFRELGTSSPPQSPVAWSNLAIGGNPGRHGVFDFIHRDPKALLPVPSFSSSTEARFVLKAGDFQLPLFSGSIKNLRGGVPFWQHLCSKGVPTSICQMPANYPPTCPCKHSSLRVLSGMGTPDINGTYGMSTLYTSKPFKVDEVVSGLRTERLQVIDGTAKSRIIGPMDPYRNVEKMQSEEAARISLPFNVWVDKKNPVVRINVSDQDLVLREGEFSDWIELDFPLLSKVQSISAIARFFVKQVRPELQLYLSPLNINPKDPAVPISQPANYASDLADELGMFYTQSMPPDTKALVHGALSDEEFLRQTDIVFEEERARLRYELNENRGGFLFHYFSVVDQVSHVFWRAIDPKHPLYSEELNHEMGTAIKDVYQKIDGVVGEVLEKIGDDALLLVVSDHGFQSFRREVNLNTLLLENSLLALSEGRKQETASITEHTDWSRTKAYALGMNGLYINLKGREREGSVSKDEYESTRTEVIQLLEQVVDPENGIKPIRSIARREELYQGEFLEQAPDLIVRYEVGYRVAWGSILGKISKEAIGDNNSKWSGTHTIHSDVVPGVLLLNKKVVNQDPELIDIAPSILKEFSVKVSEETLREIDGTPLF